MHVGYPNPGGADSLAGQCICRLKQFYSGRKRLLESHVPGWKYLGQNEAALAWMSHRREKDAAKFIILLDNTSAKNIQGTNRSDL